jgi:hypothetical protein
VNQVYGNTVGAAAVDYRRREWSVIRLKGKIPAEPWAEYQGRRMGLEEIEARPRTGVVKAKERAATLGGGSDPKPSIYKENTTK